MACSTVSRLIEHGLEFCRPVSILPLLMLAGCSLTPEQQELLSREPDPPGRAYLVERYVGQNGIECRYSDGTRIRRLNVAATCP
jgi:hypothetical protein